MKKQLFLMSLTVIALSWIVASPEDVVSNQHLATYASYGDGTREHSYEKMVANFNPSELAEFHRYWAKISIQTCQPVSADLFSGLKDWQRLAYYEDFVETCVDDSGAIIGPLPRKYDPADVMYEEWLESKRGTRRSTDFSVAELVADFNEQELKEFFNYWARVARETCRPIGTEISDGLSPDERLEFQVAFDKSCVSESGTPLGPFPRTMSAADSTYEARVMRRGL